jgi:hypothetical protein
MKNLSEEIVTDYSNISTELVLKALKKSLDEVFLEYRDSVDYYLICGGACLNIALVAKWCNEANVDLTYLVWEKKQGRYIGVSKEGEIIEFDGVNRRFNYQESEEILV